jgi:endonuclease/exonuclease/phosphatase family metal-dependent hydrolase
VSVPGLSIATWNVHGGVGRDRRYAPARIAEVVGEVDADIVALQEVGERNGESLLAALVGASGYHAVQGWTCKRWGCDYGNAVLSRFPIRECTRLDLTVSHHEPRGALDVVIDTPSRPLRVIATHLGLGPGERRLQVKRLLRCLEHEAVHPTVLTGDVNEWSLWGRPLRWLHAHFAATPAPATFPSGWPLLALDRLWTAPAGMLETLHVWRTPLARIASDHLPLVARLRWPTPAPAPIHVTRDESDPVPQ